jgi:hypothetical protein
MDKNIKAVVSKHVMVCPYSAEIAQHFRVNGYTSIVNFDTDPYVLSKGYVLKKEPKIGVDCSTERFPRSALKLLYIAFKGRQDRNFLIDILDNSKVAWEIRKLSKEMFAGDYSEDILSRWTSMTEVARSIKNTINEDAEVMFNKDTGPDGGLVKHILDKKILTEKLTLDNPLVLDIGVTIATRYNGGYAGITPWYNHEQIEHPELEEFMGIIECGNFANYSGTTVPFSLINFLLAAFGRELIFNNFVQPMETMNMFLHGKIRFSTWLDKEFDDNLNAEIARWFQLPNMTFSKLCSYATLFVLPHDVDSSTS